MSTKSFPTFETFLVCDDLRMEMGQKASLIGWYGGNNIILHPTISASGSKEVALPPIVFLFQLRGGEGRFGIRFSLTSPSGKSVAQADAGEADFSPNQNRTIFFKGGLSPRIDEFGEYEASLLVGSKRYSHAVRIDEGPPQGTLVFQSPPPAPQLRNNKGAKKKAAQKRKSKKSPNKR